MLDAETRDTVVPAWLFLGFHLLLTPPFYLCGNSTLTAEEREAARAARLNRRVSPNQPAASPNDAPEQAIQLPRQDVLGAHLDEFSDSRHY